MHHCGSFVGMVGVTGISGGEVGGTPPAHWAEGRCPGQVRARQSARVVRASQAAPAEGSDPERDQGYADRTSWSCVLLVRDYFGSMR
jgi:hypothetical protein